MRPVTVHVIDPTDEADADPDEVVAFVADVMPVTRNNRSPLRRAWRKAIPCVLSPVTWSDTGMSVKFAAVTRGLVVTTGDAGVEAVGAGAGLAEAEADDAPDGDVPDVAAGVVAATTGAR